MFASSSISETELFDTSNYRIFMVIGDRFSVTLDCLRGNHWSEDQQVNRLLSWYYNNVCYVTRSLCREFESCVHFIESEMCVARCPSGYNRSGKRLSGLD
jgi:hypothetical protein